VIPENKEGYNYKKMYGTIAGWRILDFLLSVKSTVGVAE
jgi:hypothetical protein